MFLSPAFLTDTTCSSVIEKYTTFYSGGQLSVLCEVYDGDINLGKVCLHAFGFVAGDRLD
jgi:hypothetical protein